MATILLLGSKNSRGDSALTCGHCKTVFLFQDHETVVVPDKTKAEILDKAYYGTTTKYAEAVRVAWCPACGSRNELIIHGYIKRPDHDGGC